MGECGGHWDSKILNPRAAHAARCRALLLDTSQVALLDQLRRVDRNGLGLATCVFISLFPSSSGMCQASVFSPLLLYPCHWD